LPNSLSALIQLDQLLRDYSGLLPRGIGTAVVVDQDLTGTDCVRVQAIDMEVVNYLANGPNRQLGDWCAAPGLQHEDVSDA